MYTVLSFLLTIAIVVGVHEYGHYRAALACGVRVLRFSLGFGRPLLRWQVRAKQPQRSTEFVWAAIPLGGYVQMLDSQDAAPEERVHALDVQPLWKRAVIVAAGPAANLLLAVLIYSASLLWGEEQARAIVAAPQAQSVAQLAGLQSGDWVLRAGAVGEELADIQGYGELQEVLFKAQITRSDLVLEVQSRQGKSPHEVILPLSQLPQSTQTTSLSQTVGLVGPWTAPVIAEPLPGGVAQGAGLKRGDLVLRIQGQAVEDAHQLRALIRASGREQEPSRQLWEVSRRGQGLVLAEVQPRRVAENGQMVGRIDARIGEAPAVQVVRHGLWDSVGMALARTWGQASLSLALMGKMVVGAVSWQHLSGPISIADAAGQSVQTGWQNYALFLGLISVSIGVLNLLPVPVLDGGHLMYYLWEAICGSPPSPAWLDRLQRLGLGLLLLVMGFAFFNDFQRWLGPL